MIRRGELRAEKMKGRSGVEEWRIEHEGLPEGTPVVDPQAILEEKEEALRETALRLGMREAEVSRLTAEVQVKDTLIAELQGTKIHYQQSVERLEVLMQGL